MTSTNAQTYESMLKWAQSFSQANEPTPVDGEYYDMPNMTVYTTARRALPTGGRLEVNLTAPAAQSAFSWNMEITIDDIINSKYQHLLLQTDNTIVETYGKQVIPVDNTKAQAILAMLLTLSAA